MSFKIRSEKPPKRKIFTPLISRFYSLNTLSSFSLPMNLDSGTGEAKMTFHQTKMFTDKELKNTLPNESLIAQVTTQTIDGKFVPSTYRTFLYFNNGNLSGITNGNFNFLPEGVNIIYQVTEGQGILEGYKNIYFMNSPNQLRSIKIF